MKTAAETLKAELIEFGHTEAEVDDWLKDDPESSAYIRAFYKYACEACREQRVNCANPELKDAFKHTGLGWYYLNSKDVLNTPEPELK